MRHVLKMSLAAVAGLFVSGTAFAQQPAPPAAGGTAEASTASPPSSSSEGSGKKIGLGGDLQFGLPIGDLGDVTGPQIGILLRGGYRVIPPLELTLRIGYLHGLSKTIASTPRGDISGSLSNIPIWAGARYFILQPDAGLYAGAEIGANIMNASTEAGGSSASKGLTRFGFNVGAGYVISPELPIDIRAQFSMLNLIGKDNSTETVAPGVTVTTDESSFLMLGLSVGYTFQL
jgi:hypothetical protein